MRSLLVLSVGLFLATSALALNIGDKAPPLAADTWLNGKAVAPSAADGKTTYVVEFWATWCPPCKRSIPQLNEIHDRLAGQDVVIVGVTTEPISTVKPFMEKKEMRYRVAIDVSNANAATWMEGIRTIPHSFIVDTNGIVVWSGNPLDGLDGVLTNVLAGTYKPGSETAAREKQQKLQELLMGGDMEGAVKAVDELIALDPKNFEYYQTKLGILFQARSFGGVPAVYLEIYKAFEESAKELNTLARIAATSRFPMCDLDIAWKAANRAADLTHRQESPSLDTLARVHYAAGRIRDALTVQEEALKRATSDPERAELQYTLDYYKSAIALGETIAKEAAAQPPAP
jgi:thiol-disulfide isomerase/thioredoxin